MRTKNKKTINNRSKPVFNNGLKAASILFIGLIITCIATFHTYRNIEKQVQENFASVCDEITIKISTRLHAHAQLLRSRAAFFSSSDSVTRKDWRVFNDHSEISRNLPGILGVGYAVIIPKNELPQHNERIQREGFTDYHVHPAGEREIYTAIIYLEPFSGRNLRAFGYDMFSEPARRKAMELARDNDVAMLSGRVDLVQETQEDIQSGTLMYVPVYKQGLPVSNTDERRKAILGWVYIPYRMNDLMKGTLGLWSEVRQKPIRLQVYDDSLSVASLLYDNHAINDVDNDNPNVRTLSLPVEFNGKKWILQFSRVIGSVFFLNTKVLLVFIGGIVISLLLFLLSKTLFNTMKRAQILAQKLTLELKESEEKYRNDFNLLHSIFESPSNIVIFSIDKNYCYTAFTKFHEKTMKMIWGVDIKIGMNMLDVISYQKDREKAKINFDRALQGDYFVLTEEYGDTSLLRTYYENHYSSVKNAEGLIVGVSVFVIDVTARKRFEMELRHSTLRLENIIEGTNVGTWEWNVQTGKTIFNERWAEMLGYTQEELSPVSIKTWESFTNPDDLKKSEELMNRHFEGELPYFSFECRMKHKDGHWIWIHDRGRVMSRTEDGKPLMMYGTHFDITERKQSENLLKQMRENYESFFNTIDDLLFVLDEQGNIIHTNKTVIDRLGYSKSDLLGKTVLMVHPPERREEAGRIVGEMLSGVTAFCPVPIVTKSGIRIPVETKVSHGFWDGKPVIFGVTKDISQIALSEEKFSKVFHVNPSACGLSDLDTRQYVEVNEAFYTLFGFDKEEVIGKTANDLGILTKEAIDAITDKADNNGNVKNVKANLKAKNGDIKHVLLSAENIYLQDKKYRFTVVHDITERKQAEDEISRQAGMISSLLDSTPDLIFFKDTEGVYLGCNPAFAEYIDKSKNEIIGKTEYDLFDKERADFFIYSDQEILKQKLPGKNEEWVLFPDGRKAFLETVKTAYWTTDGRVLGILGISRDMTESKIAEEEIVSTNKELKKSNAEKDKFFSIIAHDLKSPFNAIMGFSELLVEQMKEKDYDGIEKYAEIILQSSGRAMDLLMNLMEWARSQTGRMEFNPEFFEIVSLIDEIAPLFEEIAGKKSIVVKTVLPSNAPVFADKSMISTVLRNLISNAIKFTNPGGEIIISVEKNHQSELTISVCDNGVGIPKNTIEKLFSIDENYSTMGTQKEMGTGLGLILCKEFVEKHNGNIWVESEEGKGSTFYFSIPINTK